MVPYGWYLLVHKKVAALKRSLLSGPFGVRPWYQMEGTMFGVGTFPASFTLFPSCIRYHMAPKQPSRLRVITLANAKGGVGKTTIASALAVRAAEESKRVALLDLDPQESLASWWTRRGRTKNPKLFEVDAAVEAIELLISEGWEWVFVDTGPARLDLIEAGVAVSDLVLIPTRPSALDIEQAALSVELCERHGKPHAFILNAAPPSGAKLTKSSMQFLQA